MTDAERDAALQELALLRARLREDQQQVDAAVHDLLGVLAVIKGEANLLADHGRVLIDEFYRKWPEVKEIT